jgi:hypothetical protein
MAAKVTDSSSFCQTIGCFNKLAPLDNHTECLYCLTEDHFVTVTDRSCQHCLVFTKRIYNKRIDRRAELGLPTKRARSPSPPEEDRARSRKLVMKQTGRASRTSPPALSERTPLLPPKELSETPSGISPPPKGAPDLGASSDPNPSKTLVSAVAGQGDPQGPAITDLSGTVEPQGAPGLYAESLETTGILSVEPLTAPDHTEAPALLKVVFPSS